MYSERYHSDKQSASNDKSDDCDSVVSLNQKQPFEYSTPLFVSSVSPYSINNQNTPSADISGYRSFVLPTAQTLPRGRWQYENYYLFFHGVHYGVHDRVTVNGGYMFYPEGDRFSDDHYVTLGAKWKYFEHNWIRASIGAQSFKGFGESDKGFRKSDIDRTYVYGAVGNGDPDDLQYNVNFGYIFKPKGKGLYVASLDYQSRISDHFKFIGEVFIFPGFEIKGAESPFFATMGLRYVRKSMSLDTGFIVVFREFIILGFPVVNFVYKIN